MVSQEFVYNLVDINLNSTTKKMVEDLPPVKDFVALTFYATVKAGSGGAVNFLDNVKISLICDTEKFVIPARLIKLLQERYYKVKPSLADVTAGNTGYWRFILPVNIPIASFRNIQIEIDMSSAANLDTATWHVGLDYGEALAGVFLTVAENYYSYSAAGKYLFKPPIQDEILDVYIINDDNTKSDIDTIVFKIGTERLYDFDLKTARLMTALDTEDDDYLEAKDELLISFNPSIIGDNTQSLEVVTSAAADIYVYWLVRKVVNSLA